MVILDLARRREGAKKNLTSIIALTAISFSVTHSSAQPSPHLDVYPSSINLTSKRDCRQLVITGMINGLRRDFTHTAKVFISKPGIASVEDGMVTAISNGNASITISAGMMKAIIPVHVSNTQKPDPISFKFETLPVLTRQGCSTGSCHGSPHGKGGFVLSLFGYAPTVDRVSLTRDGFNRRIDVMEPADSLILKKPTLQLPHVGGKRLHKGDTAYAILYNWIAEGARADLTKVECTGISIYPPGEQVLAPQDRTRQISVLASFSDGSTRDVTRLSSIASSAADRIEVDSKGLVSGVVRGQAAVTVRYLDRVESTHFIMVEPVKGFAWKAPVELDEIDRLTDSRLKLLQYAPSDPCSDSVFVRRLYLDLTGLLPTANQARAFLFDSSPTKRSSLIDRLLETEEHARFWAMKRADIMRVSPAYLKGDRAAKFSDWIVDSVRSNMPYNEFTRELITASGDTEKSPAACYYLAVPTMEDRTEMTAEIFLGSRVECARCHNHPFENWTMRDYYSIGAVFARVNTNGGMVTLAGSGETINPNSGETMRPYGTHVEPAALNESQDRRAAFADWLVSPDNPLFARVEVNRIWAALTGMGIVEPVDDFRSSNPPSNGPLLDWLAERFVKSGYDCKAMIRLICNSAVYQRSSEANRFNADDETLFSHARVRMFTAEQVKDAIGMVTHALPEVASERKAYATESAYPISSEFMSAFGQPERSSACTCERQSAPTLLQALELLNGPTAYAMAQRSTAFYSGLDDDKLIDELYLTALSRPPTAHEKTIALSYLKRVGDRKAAVTDLAWTMVNIREFLFQH